MNAQGIKLYDILVGPVQKLIAPGSRVLILPDAGLYGLNFETLLDPKPKLHYWIEDAVVAYANSLVLLAASANQPVARTKKLLLVGNPISPSAEFPDLPQAGAEMMDVSDILRRRSARCFRDSRLRQRLSPKQAEAIFVYSFRGARYCQPRQPA